MEHLYAHAVPPVPKKGLRASALESGAVVLSYDLNTVVQERLDSLPRAEREVVERMLEGASDEQIAEQRGCSRHTVSNLLRSAYRRVGVSNRTELASYLTSEPSSEQTD